MPPTDTICMSLGNWIVAFYVVYAMAAVAPAAASAVVIDWGVKKVRASRVAATAKVGRRAEVVQSRA
jgi:hypothetical protein